DPFVSMLVERVLSTLPAGWWSPDDRFAEVFQLWVEPTHRRQGIATGLKRHLEARARTRGIGIVYTHTLADDEHVLALNRRLGYVEVRRGGLWDSQVRVSLIKRV
ncbi:MAG: GNAT family N-acetyltransferase, partial [Myxococcales bacterium]|nr:GNAT family N-acetyltransferase [Myxococcales bacterium]